MSPPRQHPKTIIRTARSFASILLRHPRYILSAVGQKLHFVQVSAFQRRTPPRARSCGDLSLSATPKLFAIVISLLLGILTISQVRRGKKRQLKNHPPNQTDSRGRKGQLTRESLNTCARRRGPSYTLFKIQGPSLLGSCVFFLNVVFTLILLCLFLTLHLTPAAP